MFDSPTLPTHRGGWPCGARRVWVPPPKENLLGVGERTAHQRDSRKPWPRLQCRLGIWPLLALLSHSQIKKAPHSALSLHRAALEGRRTAERASIQIQGNPSVLVRHRFACTSFRSSIIGRMPGSARENWTAFLFAESGSGSHGNWNLRF